MRRNTALTFTVLYTAGCILACVGLAFYIGPPVEGPNHKTRQDQMDQLDRIESKVDQLIELGEEWQ